MDQEPRALIKRHNEYVREQVVQDLEALEEKLNVKRQVSEKAHTVVDKAKGTLGMNQDGQVHGAKGFVRKNAVPLAAVGLGGALLARNTRQMMTHDERFETTYPVYAGTPPTTDTSDGNGIGAKAGDVKHAAASKVSGATSAMSDKAGSMKDSVSGTVSNAGSTISDASTTVAVRASEMKDTVAEKAGAVVDRVPSRQQTIQAAKENAPVVGFAALAVGALAGAFIPRTRMEEERLAPMQEQVIDKATHAVEDTVDKTKEALQAGAEKVGEEMGSGSSSDSSSSSEVDPLVTTPNRITGAGATNGANYGTPAGSL
jgi:hypothetical protein